MPVTTCSVFRFYRDLFRTFQGKCLKTLRSSGSSAIITTGTVVRRDRSDRFRFVLRYRRETRGPDPGTRQRNNRVPKLEKQYIPLLFLHPPAPPYREFAFIRPKMSASRVFPVRHVELSQFNASLAALHSEFPSNGSFAPPIPSG